MHLIGFAESNYLPSAFDNEVLSDGFCQRPRGSESHGCRHSAPRPEGTGAPRHPQPRSPCQDPHSPWGRWGGGCPWLLGSAPALWHCRTRCCSGGCRNQPGACGQMGAGGCTHPSCCLPAPAASPHPCSASPSPAPSPGAVGPAEALGPWLPTPAAAALPLVTAGPSCPPPRAPRVVLPGTVAEGLCCMGSNACSAPLPTLFCPCSHPIKLMEVGSMRGCSTHSAPSPGSPLPDPGMGHGGCPEPPTRRLPPILGLQPGATRREQTLGSSAGATTPQPPASPSH